MFDLFWQYMSAQNFAGMIVAIWMSHLGPMALGLFLAGPFIWLYNRYQTVVVPAIAWTVIFGVMELWIPTPGISFGKAFVILGIWVIYMSLLLGGRKN